MGSAAGGSCRGVLQWRACRHEQAASKARRTGSRSAEDEEDRAVGTDVRSNLQEQHDVYGMHGMYVGARAKGQSNLKRTSRSHQV